MNKFKKSPDKVAVFLVKYQDEAETKTTVDRLERAKYWGLPKLNIQSTITAIVINVKRFVNVLGERMLSKNVR